MPDIADVRSMWDELYSPAHAQPKLWWDEARAINEAVDESFDFTDTTYAAGNVFYVWSDMLSNHADVHVVFAESDVLATDVTWSLPSGIHWASSDESMELQFDDVCERWNECTLLPVAQDESDDPWNAEISENVNDSLISSNTDADALSEFASLIVEPASVSERITNAKCAEVPTISTIITDTWREAEFAIGYVKSSELPSDVVNTNGLSVVLATNDGATVSTLLSLVTSHTSHHDVNAALESDWTTNYAHADESTWADIVWIMWSNVLLRSVTWNVETDASVSDLITIEE